MVGNNMDGWMDGWMTQLKVGLVCFPLPRFDLCEPPFYPRSRDKIWSADYMALQKPTTFEQWTSLSDCCGVGLSENWKHCGAWSAMSDGERTEDWWRMWKLPITILLHPPPSHHGNLMSTSKAQRRFRSFWYWQPSHSHKGGPFPFLPIPSHPITIVVDLWVALVTTVSWSSKHLKKLQLVPSEPLFTWFHHGIKGWPEILFTMIIHIWSWITNHDSWSIMMYLSLNIWSSSLPQTWCIAARALWHITFTSTLKQTPALATPAPDISSHPTSIR